MKTISHTVIDRTSEEAKASPRKRAVLLLHRHEDAVQRMLNAIEPESYIRPHKHEAPDKVELYFALRGGALVVQFDDKGVVTDTAVITPHGPILGVEIEPRTWHTLVALESGTVLLEIIEGPYDERTHKRFAPWSPATESEGRDYLRDIVRLAT